ncbi:hypothetical protein R6Q59_025207, partial [Mikania micrantha]
MDIPRIFIQGGKIFECFFARSGSGATIVDFLDSFEFSGAKSRGFYSALLDLTPGICR